MMAQPKTLAPAAVSPSSTLVRMGDMRKKNIRLQARNCLPVETRLAASPLADGGKPRRYVKSVRDDCSIALLRFWRRAISERRETPMRHWLQLIGWLACVVCSTIPAFRLMIHPFAYRWRVRHRSYRRSPYRVLLPAWIAMWGVAALVTRSCQGILVDPAGRTLCGAELLVA